MFYFGKRLLKVSIDYIVSNHTCDLYDLLKGCKPISRKWIFKKKLRPDGIIDKLLYKARLVIRGFKQKKRVDNFDNFSPVTKIATTRTLIALGAIHDLVVHQMHVKTTSLNGDLEEEIYMTQPEVFVISGQDD